MDTKHEADEPRGLELHPALQVIGIAGDTLIEGRLSSDLDPAVDHDEVLARDHLSYMGAPDDS